MPLPTVVRRSALTAACLSAALVPTLGTPAQAATHAAAAPSAGSTSVIGTWSGLVKGDAGASGAYRVKVKLFKKAGKVTATTVTPGYCTSHWTLTGHRGKVYSFLEHVDKGKDKCVQNVRVKVQRVGANLRVSYTEPMGDTASMLAKRVK